MKFKPSAQPIELVEYCPKKHFDPIGVPSGTRFAAAPWQTHSIQITESGDIGTLSIPYLAYRSNKEHFKTIKFLDEHYEEIDEETAVLKMIMFHRGMLSKLYKRLRDINGK